jgi:hypothetical protein|nr:MAG TPA: hypothetical protein [Caudoviricetes sp.]
MKTHFEIEQYIKEECKKEIENTVQTIKNKYEIQEVELKRDLSYTRKLKEVLENNKNEIQRIMNIENINCSYLPFYYVDYSKIGNERGLLFDELFKNREVIVDCLTHLLKNNDDHLYILLEDFLIDLWRKPEYELSTIKNIQITKLENLITL